MSCRATGDLLETTEFKVRDRYVQDEDNREVGIFVSKLVYYWQSIHHVLIHCHLLRIYVKNCLGNRGVLGNAIVLFGMGVSG